MSSLYIVNLKQKMPSYFINKTGLFGSSEVSEVAQSCLTLCDPVDCSLPGPSIQFPWWLRR